MTKKEFYSLIDEFIKSGYDEKAEIRLYEVLDGDDDGYSAVYGNSYRKWEIDNR